MAERRECLALVVWRHKRRVFTPLPAIHRITSPPQCRLWRLTPGRQMLQVASPGNTPNGRIAMCFCADPPAYPDCGPVLEPASCRR